MGARGQVYLRLEMFRDCVIDITPEILAVIMSVILPESGLPAVELGGADPDLLVSRSVRLVRLDRQVIFLRNCGHARANDQHSYSKHDNGSDRVTLEHSLPPTDLLGQRMRRG